MHLDSIDKILAQLENQPGWEKFREHRLLLTCWERVVSKQIAAHTRPLSVARQILYVATSSASRAQELSFQRYTLLKRLNKQLPFELKEIRFSSSGWHQKTQQIIEQPALFTISDRHKSKTALSSSTTQKQEDTTQNKSCSLSAQDKAKQAALRWIKMAEQRALNSLVCPKCNSLATKEELDRWNLCHHCIAQQWSDKYRVPEFSESKFKKI